MKIKMKETVVGAFKTPDGEVKKGEEVTVDNSVGQYLVDTGVATKVHEEKKDEKKK